MWQPSREPDAGAPRVGVVYYRAHEPERQHGVRRGAVRGGAGGRGRTGAGVLRLPARAAPPGHVGGDAADLLAVLGSCDVLVTTVLAAGGTVAADASAGATTTRGTPGRWARSTCRCCRAWR
nr:hypothetical protein [Angustibacter aerolatus]